MYSFLHGAWREVFALAHRWKVIFLRNFADWLRLCRSQAEERDFAISVRREPLQRILAPMSSVDMCVWQRMTADTKSHALTTVLYLLLQTGTSESLAAAVQLCNGKKDGAIVGGMCVGLLDGSDTEKGHVQKALMQAFRDHAVKKIPQQTYIEAMTTASKYSGPHNQ